MGDNLVEKVIKKIRRCSESSECSGDPCFYEGRPIELTLKECVSDLAAIPSLSFDEAVEKVIASGNFAGTGLMIKAALKALTANGDVLIRGKSTSGSLAQSAKEQAE